MTDKRTDGQREILVSNIGGQKNSKIAKKIAKTFFWDFFLPEKNFTLSFSISEGRDSTRALQYSPFQISGGVVQA